jgi:exodeoxyribonuclease VII large subunit
MSELVLSVSDFVAVFNQTLEYAYPNVSIVGELANFRVSKNRWVYFDLKDEYSSVKFFGTVYQLPGPLEDGLMVQVTGQPRLHNLYGFSVHILVYIYNLCNRLGRVLLEGLRRCLRQN